MQFDLCKTSRIGQLGGTLLKFEGVEPKGKKIQANYKTESENPKLNKNSTAKMKKWSFVSILFSSYVVKLSICVMSWKDEGRSWFL